MIIKITATHLFFGHWQDVQLSRYSFLCFLQLFAKYFFWNYIGLLDIQSQGVSILCNWTLRNEIIWTTVNTFPVALQPNHLFYDCILKYTPLWLTIQLYLLIIIYIYKTVPPLQVVLNDDYFGAGSFQAIWTYLNWVISVQGRLFILSFTS